MSRISLPSELDSRGRARRGCRLCGRPKAPGRGRQFCSDRCSKRASQLSLQRYTDERKARLDAYKTQRGCDRCGYSRCPAALDFHHRDPATKLFHVTRQAASEERTQAEIAKCDLLCANCHREVHFETNDSRMSRDPNVYYDDGFDARHKSKRWKAIDESFATATCPVA